MLLAQIEQCDQILAYHGNGSGLDPDTQPEHELDLMLVAAIAGQSKALAPPVLIQISQKCIKVMHAA